MLIWEKDICPLISRLPALRFFGKTGDKIKYRASAKKVDALFISCYIVRMEYNLQRIHGSNVAREGLALFDSGKLQLNDRLMFPLGYHLFYKEQIRKDFYRELQDIQSYLVTRDFTI